MSTVFKQIFFFLKFRYLILHPSSISNQVNLQIQETSTIAQQTLCFNFNQDLANDITIISID